LGCNKDDNANEPSVREMIIGKWRHSKGNYAIVNEFRADNIFVQSSYDYDGKEYTLRKESEEWPYSFDEGTMTIYFLTPLSLQSQQFGR